MGFGGAQLTTGDGLDEFVVGVEDVFGRIVVVGVGVWSALGDLREVEVAVVHYGDEAFEDELERGGIAGLGCGDGAAGDVGPGFLQEGLRKARGFAELVLGTALGIWDGTRQELAFGVAGNGFLPI